MTVRKPPKHANVPLGSAIEALKRKKFSKQKVVDLNDFKLASAAERDRTILVCDPSASWFNAVKRTLRSQSLNVVGVTEVEDLPASCSSRQIDVIFLAVDWPWVCGSEICRILKTHQETKHIAVFLVCDPDTVPSQDSLSQSLCDDIIMRPLQGEVLQSKIDVVFSKNL
ncbi:MAG: hypothetical protein HRU19_08340 [Pseudobacteriovorax sp.]|nr:hypothetical protein [Pseudobacteriovorax sp.]